MVAGVSKNLKVIPEAQPAVMLDDDVGEGIRYVVECIDPTWVVEIK